jgi:hypothetical protein
LPASIEGCAECLKTDSTWVHLSWCFVDEVTFFVDPSGAVS